MDSESLSLFLQQSSDRNSDRFQPQNIQPIQKQLSMKHSSISESPAMSINESRKQYNHSPSNFVRKQTRERQIIKPPTKINPQPQNGFLKLILQKKILKKFIDSLLNQAHIYPKQQSEKMKSLLQEQFICGQKKKQSELDELQNICFVFNPISKFIYFWNVIKLIQLFVLLAWAPFKISFQPEFTGIISTIELIILLIFFGDLVIKLNQGVIDQGQVEKNRMKILKSYIRHELFYDVINIFATLILMNDQLFSQNLLLEIIGIIQFVLTLSKFHGILIKYQETLDVQSSIIEAMNLLDLVVLIFFFAHFMACAWYYVGTHSEQYSHKTWITVQNLQNQPIVSLYCYSYYWATMTMVTVGYGDITAQNVYEVLCSIIMMFGASVIFAYSINAIGNILNNLNSQKFDFQKKLLLINSYMNSNNVSIELQSRVRNYLKFYLQEELYGSQNEVNLVLDKLSTNLQQELLFDVQSKVISKCKLFQTNFSQKTLREVALNLQHQSFIPGEIVYKQKATDEQFLYIIQKGSIQLIEENSGKILHTYQENDSFGELEFFTQQERYCSAYSNSFTQLCKIQRSSFINIIQKHEDFQIFSQIKDELLLKYENNHINCFACSKRHTVQDCPVLHYVPDLEYLVKKQAFQIQSRSTFKRQIKIKYNLRLNLEEIQKRCKQFQDDQIKQHTYMVEQNQIIEKVSSRYLEEKYQSSSDNQAQSPIQKNAVSPSYRAVTPGRTITPTHFLNEEHQQTQQTPLFQGQEGQISSIFDEKNNSFTYQIPKRNSGTIHLPTKIVVNNTDNFQFISSSSLPMYMTEELKFCLLDEGEISQFQNCDLDKIATFTDYFPENNVNIVIELFKKYQQIQKEIIVKCPPKEYRFYRYQYQIRKNSIKTSNKSKFHVIKGIDSLREA